MPVHYFSLDGPRHQGEYFVKTCHRKMCLEKHKVVLFWDSATCHTETLQASLTNIKLVFLPKNTTLQLQPLDPSVIKNFKHKFRKLLVCYAITRIDEGKTVSQITEDIHALKAIAWLQTTWKSVSTETIKQCFKKYGFEVGDISVINKEMNTEFQELFVQMSSEITPDEYIDFDAETIISEPAVNPTHVDWGYEWREKKHCRILAIRRHCFNQ